MATVSIDNVRKSFGSTEVLKGISIDIEDGELLVILGPSGCGKSTLLRLVAGLEQISSGEIRIGGKRVNDLEPMQRDIAMVFQNYALYPHMKVYDNMAYGLRNQRRPKDEIDRRVKEAARILGLEDFLDRKPRQLSGGQRQRVAMGRAIVREPRVFLFDEPLSNLDAKLRVQMRHEIRELQKRLKTTGVYVTHDQVEAMTLGDRLMILNHGEVEQIGTPLEVYNRPASTFVASFIGAPAMNLLEAGLDGDGAAVRLGRQLLPLESPVRDQGERPILLGMRPEHMVPAEAAGEADDQFAITIAWVEQLGADTIAHGRLDDGQALSIRLPGNTPVGEDSNFKVGIAPKNLHLFDKETGRRLR